MSKTLRRLAASVPCLLGWRFLVFASLLLPGSFQPVVAQRGGPAGGGDGMLSAAVDHISQAPPPVRHFESFSEGDLSADTLAAERFELLQREKAGGNWFAALVSEHPGQVGEIVGRFRTWGGLMDYLQDAEVMVEVWAYGADGQRNARRIPATELAAWPTTLDRPPTFITVVQREPASGLVVTNRLEFGFDAARMLQTSMLEHASSRKLQLTAARILGTRTPEGQRSTRAQWDALQAAAADGSFPIIEIPPLPRDDHDLLVCFEFESDGAGNLRRPVRAYRGSDIEKSVKDGIPALLLNAYSQTNKLTAIGFRRVGVSDDWEIARHPIPGEDAIELRIVDAAEPDQRLWHVLEFGEPELLRQSALASFSLLSAHLERQRKAVAVKRANLALIAEPIIAGVNIGGGMAGIGFPAGAAVRLAYNTVSLRLLLKVPTVRQMRELFATMAALERNPELMRKAQRWLSPEDIRQLREQARRLTDAQVKEYIDSVSVSDLEGMLRIARMGMWDDRVTSFMNLLTSAFLVSGVSEQDGVLRDIFNNVYFSMNGDINISTIFLVAIGQREATALSGVSLNQLVNGEGNPEAWAQFFTVSVDVRAVANTVVRWFKPTYARKELEKPFPYAPNMADLAAYEFRAFGFPLLLFYKRGLIRADARAFDEDYAYGLLGPRVIEHFKTREAMDVEIRAGRMVPLGYVRVYGGRAGWKHTNLAVFAHRIAAGKYRGKTSVIVYGLRAFQEQSELIAREYRRFEQYESALREGGVIEQIAAVQLGADLPAAALEPVIHVGSDESERLYKPLLGRLTELHRLATRRAWGLALSADQAAQEKTLRDELSSQGIELPEEGPGLQVDNFSSSFTYRRVAKGLWQQIKVVNVTGSAALQQGLADVEEGWRIERARRQVALGELPAMVFLNEAVRRGDRYELGPLLRDERGEVEGTGILSAPAAVEAFLDRLATLPVTDQARLRFNHFAATLVALELPGRGPSEKVFVTVEFPPGESRRKRTNPLTGESEIVVHERGLWRQTITARRILELEYEAQALETGSRTFANAGTLAEPRRGELIEETRTLDVWLRNLSLPETDPYSPLISKLRLNRVTGATARETYGLFPLPVTVADADFVRSNRFNASGVFESSSVRENDAPTGEGGPARALDALLRPVVGRERFAIEAESEAGVGKSLARPNDDFCTRIRRTDLVRGVTEFEVIDRNSFGRLREQVLPDPFDGTQAFTNRVTYEYSDAYLYGLVPQRSVTVSVPGGVPLCTVQYLGCDPVRRQLTGVQVDFTGKRTTNVWQWPADHPAVVASTLRRSLAQVNRDNTRFTATTIGQLSGEPIRDSAGAFDAGTGTYQMTRTNWYRPGIPQGTEQALLSVRGRTISLRTGDVLEARPVYDADGREIARRTFARDPGTGRFDLLVREESDYQWLEGRRRARVQTYLAGQPHDAFEIQADEEGRVIVDGRREALGVRLETRIQFDSDTERVTRVELEQNGHVRRTDEVLPAVVGADGVWRLPFRSIPAWGLRATNWYRLNDPFGRRELSALENGDQIVVSEWFGGSALAHVSLVRDRLGRPKQQLRLEPGTGEPTTLALDRVVCQRIAPWGEAFWAESTAFLRGSEVAVYTEAADFRLYQDLDQVVPAPSYRQDPSGKVGAFVQIGGIVRSNIVAVMRASPAEYRTFAEARGEEVLAVESVDLRNPLRPVYERRQFDRAGKVIEVTLRRLPGPGRPDLDADKLIAAGRSAPLDQTVVYRYEPGEWVPEPDTPASRPVWKWSSELSAGAADAVGRLNEPPWRDWPTGIEITKRTGGDDLGILPGRFVAERIAEPRLMRVGPFLGGVTNLWTAWSSTHFDTAGEPLYTSQVVQGAAGEPALGLDHKRTGRGEPAVRLAYSLGLPSDSQWLSITNLHSSALDLQRADFIALVFENPNPAVAGLGFRDAAGREIQLGNTESPAGPREVSAWPLGTSEALWLPDEIAPRYGASLGASPVLLANHAVRAVSVAELARAGLDLRQPVVCTVRLESDAGGVLRLAGPLVFQDRERPEFGALEQQTGFRLQRHGDGLQVITRKNGEPASLNPEDERQSVLLQGREIGRIAVSDRLSGFTRLVLLDQADPDFPRPLYALDAADGSFLHYFQSLRGGDTRVFTAAAGFSAPMLNVFRSGILDDELAPGMVVFGDDHPIQVPLVRGGAGIARAVASLRNRWAASIFDLGAQRVADFIVGRDSSQGDFARFRRANQAAAVQAKAINQLPMLAAALVPRRPLPWGAGSSAPPSVTGIAEANRIRLGGYWRRELGDSPLGLIPAQPGSSEQQFVATEAEARLIELAVRLNDFAGATEMLGFYQGVSQNGVKAVHSSYDLRSGAALVRHPSYERPLDAPKTALAQIALAEAAFYLGAVRGDTNALVLGRNLVDLLLVTNRLSMQAPWPRGLLELEVQLPKSKAGLTFWPEAARYSLESNARFLLLLDRVQRLTNSPVLPPAWRREMAVAASEQAAWITNHVFPELASSGVAPRGAFEIQDLRGDTTALALERWTSSAAWLAFLEVAPRLGVPLEQAKTWLENLARAHGTIVDGLWGLDWGIALKRSDAISPALTARFARVADVLGHTEAAAFARRNLDQMRQGDYWPAVLTHEPAIQPLATGQGSWVFPRPPASATSNAVAWPADLTVPLELLAGEWPAAVATGRVGGGADGDSDLSVSERDITATERDLAAFLWTVGAFYALLIGVTLFWWGLNALRRRTAPTRVPGSGSLVSAAVMQLAEERWARRVLGVLTPPAAEHSRFSNGAIEQNFHMQLRAIYKLVLEYRRLSNGWEEEDRELVENDRDEWLNGLDAFAAMVGIYSRWVFKAGRKDGGRRKDVLAGSEDSNHIWSRLVFLFSEFHLELLELLRQYKADPMAAIQGDGALKLEAVLQAAGIRPRLMPFDARAAFNAPADPDAMDLLALQLPNASLPALAAEMEAKLGIPRDDIIAFLQRYQDFKAGEDLYPIHPYILEVAKLLPHFTLMGLAALIWHTYEIGGLRIYRYLGDTGIGLLQDRWSLLWGVPLALGLLSSVLARVLSVYRYRYRIRSHAQSQMLLDKTVTSFFTKDARPEDAAQRERVWWHPLLYDRWGWALRAVGLGALGTALLQFETPNFVAWMFVKAFVVPLLLIEAACIGLPLASGWFAGWLEDRVAGNPRGSAFLRFVNQLNFVRTRPASVFWLSIKYHFQPSVATGGAGAVVSSMLFYIVFSAAFFAIGGYLYKQALEVWFLNTYRTGGNLALLIGAGLFWATMYLLRFGLFVFLAAIASAVVTFPIRTFGALVAVTYLGLLAFETPARFLQDQGHFLGLALPVGLALMLFEPEVLAWLGNRTPFRQWRARRRADDERGLEAYRADPQRAFAVVYMSGDDLAFQKLTPDLLMTRLRFLRDRFDSRGLALLSRLVPHADDASFEAGFRALYELERARDLTLWHPVQVSVRGEPPALDASLGLSFEVDSVAARDALLASWHLRRWLVTMMSTAGHSQDTAINLVDVAFHLHQERLAPQAVFYLIQNKYDNAANNRPAQVPYDRGELGQRNKLARLLMAAAPGCRAYSVNDWTPFGFKAGGLVGMDMVHEESLKLTNMLVLDRNANAHDLDAVMEDLKMALADPGVVIVIPGRGTTNTLTPLGQASQCIEEGNRALLKGVMLVGGAGGESLGTGWGNIQAVHYGRVQAALCDPATPLMPLTSRTGRGAGFGERTTGLIGFGPHAVGISEDIWGVTQAAHNAIALGLPVRFRRSRAIWHKVRETWSHAEWFSAFPRWSGGYVQMMLDPIMQRINDGGPLSVFAKEIRCNGGRFFLGAPVALITILLMPLAIIGEVSPFVKLLILLWNFGLLMNQVLTSLGLLSCLEATGFKRATALAGTLAAGLACYRVPALRDFQEVLLPLGLLAGGFAVGLGRWLHDRGRDLVMFGPQLVIHALGQFVRQSLEFVLSGASANDARAVNIAFRAWVGPREDRPWERYGNIVNLRTVVWGVGLAAFLLNLFALANLDFLNVVLLLPTLLFSVSCLLGPFLMRPAAGRAVGARVVLAKTAGWAGGFGFFMLLAWAMIRGGLTQALAFALLALCLGGFLRTALRYVCYAGMLRRLTQQLAGHLATAGCGEPARLAGRIVSELGGDPSRTESLLSQVGVPATQQAACVQFVRDELQPAIRKPVADLDRGFFACHPWFSAAGRSFTLAFFVLVWFVVVPMPGLLAFQAPGGYRFSLPLTSLMYSLAGLLAVVLAARLLSRALDWWQARGSSRASLFAGATRAWQEFQSQQGPGNRLAPHQVSGVYGLFTDLQTYVEQRSTAFARRTLASINRILAAAAARRDDSSNS